MNHGIWLNIVDMPKGHHFSARCLGFTYVICVLNKAKRIKALSHSSEVIKLTSSFLFVRVVSSLASWAVSKLIYAGLNLFRACGGV